MVTRGLPTWVSAAVFFLLINAINLANVVKWNSGSPLSMVIAIVAMIVFGAWLLLRGRGGPEASVTNLWAQGGFLPHCGKGLLMAMAVIMFSFVGLEMVVLPPPNTTTRRAVFLKPPISSFTAS